MAVHVRRVIGILSEERAQVFIAHNGRKERVPGSDAGINHANDRRVGRRGNEIDQVARY